MSDAEIQRGVNAARRAGVNPATLCTPKEIAAAFALLERGDRVKGLLACKWSREPISLASVAGSCVEADGDASRRAFSPVRSPRSGSQTFRINPGFNARIGDIRQVEQVAYAPDLPLWIDQDGRYTTADQGGAPIAFTVREAP